MIKWIKASEQLPEDNSIMTNMYIVRCKNKGLHTLQVCRYYSDTKTWHRQSDLERKVKINVVYWIKLPKSPDHLEFGYKDKWMYT